MSPLETRTDFSARVLEAMSAKRTRAIAFLLVLAAFAFLPGLFSMPPMDRDEPRFAQASKQMLETGDFVNIRFQDEARLKKPVGIYWLQSASVAVAGAVGVTDARDMIGWYRLPSLLGAVAAVLLTWWVAIPLVGPRGAVLAGAMMAACVLLGVEARLAKTDAVLLATVLAMIGVVARLFLASSRPDAAPPSRGLPVLFWPAMAASILIKGPIGPMVVGLTILSLVLTTRRWQWLRGLHWVAGLAATVLMVSPWFVAIMIETGGHFLQASVGDDMLNKVAGGQESHGAPPGLYALVFWATFWPAAPLAALAAPWAWRHRARPQVLFLLCWLLPTWLLFEAVPTKLPHYVLPVYPAIAILIGAALVEGGLSRSRWTRWPMLLVPALALLLAVAAPVAVWHFQGTVAWLFLPFGLAGAALAVFAWKRHAAAPLDGLALSFGAAIVLYWGVYWAGMPSLPALWPAPRLAMAAKALDCSDPLFASAGYREPSLVFLVSTTLEMPEGPGAADFLGAGGCRMAFVERREEGAFLARLAATGTRAVLSTRVAGININGGKPLDIGVYRPAN